MINDLAAVTRHRASVSSMIHGLMLYDYENGCPGMKLKEIAAAIGISVVSCSRAHNGVQSLSSIPFVRLQELYKKRFNHEYISE